MCDHRLCETLFLLITAVIICGFSYFYIIEQPAKHILQSIFREVSFEHLSEWRQLPITGATKRFGAVERIYIINLPNRIDRRTR